MSSRILIRDVMSQNILECAPSETIQGVARRMSQLKCSSMLVVENDRAVGIWTEKDALKTHFDEPDCGEKCISEVMSAPVKTLSGKIPLEDAADHLNQAGIRHFLVVNEDGARVGIITQTDIVSRQDIENFLYMSKVSSIVTHVPFISSEASLSEASQWMLRYRLEALAVSSSSGSLGIISERDLVRALGRQPIPATVGEVSSPKMISVRESDSIFHARNLMVDNGFRHLGVKNAMNQHTGMISFSSILESIRENARNVMKQVMEKALRQRTAEFKAIFHSMADCVLFTDNNRIIKTVNSAFIQLFGYSAKEVVGKQTDLLYANGNGGGGDKEQARIYFNLGIEGEESPFEMNYRRKDGGLFTGETVASIVKDEQGDTIGCLEIIRNITERKEAEIQIKSALSEKEVLLKEIHHRVKNNLQIVSSLLRLQANTIDDEKYREMLTDSQERVQSMALVHEQLYQDGDLGHVDFRAYVSTLAENLLGFHSSASHRITLKKNMEKIDLSIETAIPSGLIVNELITNCLKHAFPEGKGGEIILCLRSSDDGEIVLGISDTGIGLPTGFHYEKNGTLGLQLIHMLAKQLKGTIVVNEGEGTSVEIRFKEAVGSRK